MSSQYGKLCSLIIKQYFGETVQIVADILFSSFSRTLSALIKSTNLSKSDVALALGVLIKFDLLNVTPSIINENVNEYSLKKENIIYVLRYPKYVYLMQTKFGNTSATIIEELLRSGSHTASNIIIKCFSSPENKDSLSTLRDAFVDLINGYYLKRFIPPSWKLEDPSYSNKYHQLSDTSLFAPPDLDLFEIQQIIDGKITMQQTKTKDHDILWQINFQRFHQDIRDEIMTLAIGKKINSSAAECFRYVLKKMYERTNPWIKGISNPVTLGEIRQIIDKNSNNLDLIKYIDQYVSLIADDSLNCIQRLGEMGGGQFSVDIGKIFKELAICCIESIITEKFGSKASRIFRIIKTKKYIEQEDLQKEAMIPAKEAKLLTYKLFEEQYIQIKTIRKAGGGGSGPAKSFYLFYINPNQLVKMLLDFCFKALYNILTRSTNEKIDNKRLIDKSQKVESIAAAMKERGESEDYIKEILETLTPPERESLNKIRARLRMLSKAELVLDETIFLFQMYIYYNETSKEIIKY